ncbi:MAG: helix-turn-helix domain-containing protein [Methylicorpusculum sp.]|jgi:putative transcriptional regulator|uniref:helix-turn-helix domain-containing protein n=1 Tax=Methylicorpusculum TaxID=2713642 RepID=UPI0019D2C0C6|nr:MULTISPECIES: helix-turn-helix domain-containing protein [Methylicorpusculum]MCD2453545.1 helix-turn-helix domain-containing protein [Methylicorpusculum oleiharenae]MDO8937550.1 helix-turn-helix domain-containing protein [Methylicorpusculum sp.]MDO9241516.1 helix-turn-helix domain-containing protein [Methylicorpusculum sp.]MDP2177082.1 helix-turn-helix domain-containing protein [Methylicorpusculum sp.]MDP3529337.1 helix-turn-helix domain-containing protein [Methylicorpusculum sp.]
MANNMQSPSTEQIKKSRMDAGLTQSQAASLIYSELRTWQHWEKGDRVMHPAFFELFTIKSAMNNGRK